MDQELLIQPAEAFQTPQWVHDAIFYQIFPDRFARSWEVPKPSNLESWDSPPTRTGFKGGDLSGIVEHLDYLQDLGITALYLNPIFRSTANHRYHTHDYFAVDPILGGNEAYHRFVDEVHKRDMRVVLDGVFNHASRGFFQFNHLLENGPASPYVDWFHVSSWPLHAYPEGDQAPGYECWWNLPDLPKFATNSPAVREFLWSVGEYWIRQGADGWRLDVPGEIDDDEFWREFRRRVKGVNADAYIVGEIWEDARRWLAGDQFDGVMNYVFTRACLGFFAGFQQGVREDIVNGTGLSPVRALDAPEFRSAIDSLLESHPGQATLAQLNLLSSHDTPRYLTAAGGDESSWKLATLFQMTYPGAPCIYYGDEVGMEGTQDPDCRRSFPWDKGLWHEGLRSFAKRAIELRRQHAVFRRGNYQSLEAQGGLYVFARTLDDTMAVIALNADHSLQTVDVDFPGGARVHDLRVVCGDLAPDVVDEGVRAWSVPPRSGAILLGRLDEAPITEA